MSEVQRSYKRWCILYRLSHTRVLCRPTMANYCLAMCVDSGLVLSPLPAQSPPTLPQSFQQIESWHQKIIDECGEKIAIVLVENKMDMVADSTISPEEVEALATKLCLKLYRTSCKRDINVKEVRSRSDTATHARIQPTTTRNAYAHVAHV